MLNIHQTRSGNGWYCECDTGRVFDDPQDAADHLEEGNKWDTVWREKMLDRKFADFQEKLDSVSNGSRMRGGGHWLGAARRFIQERFHNGDSVTWGSLDELRPTARVRDLEEIAAEVVAEIYRKDVSLLLEEIRKLLEQRDLAERKVGWLEQEFAGELQQRTHRLPDFFRDERGVSKKEAPPESDTRSFQERWAAACDFPACRANSGRVSHSFCRAHRKLVKEKEEEMKNDARVATEEDRGNDR